MKILYCTDGSKTSLNAIKSMKFNLKKASIDLICVIDWSFLPEKSAPEDTFPLKVYEDLAESILNNVAKELELEGLNVQNKIKETGSTVEKILNHSKPDDYSMVVLGSNGKHGLQKWLGAVSYQIAYNSEIPVYVTKRINNFKNVLFTIDGSEENLKSLERAINSLNLEDKNIYICSILEVNEFLFVENSVDSAWVNQVEKQRRLFLENSMTSIELLLNEYKLNVFRKEILSGNPAELIIDYARKEEIDLIVMGNVKKTAISNFILGSVSRRVLEHTLSDCLIVK